jgi:hypothetical protein
MNIEATVYRGEVTEVFVDGEPASPFRGDHCRQVFKIGNLFVKFDNPHHCGDWDEKIQTQLELENIGHIDEEDKKYFCLPVAWGEVEGLWYTVQEEVNHEIEPTEEDVEELEQITHKYGFHVDVGVNLFGLHNCAFTRDGWKIYDYSFRE